MENSFGAALRVEITDILCNLLGVKKPGDVVLAELLPEAILREPQVCAITNLSHATIRRRVSAGTFPPPLKLGDDRQGGASGWLASEVTQWMRNLRREDPVEYARSIDLAKRANRVHHSEIPDYADRKPDVLIRTPVNHTTAPGRAIKGDE